MPVPVVPYAPEVPLLPSVLASVSKNIVETRATYHGRYQHEGQPCWLSLKSGVQLYYVFQWIRSRSCLSLKCHTHLRCRFFHLLWISLRYPCRFRTTWITYHDRCQREDQLCWPSLKSGDQMYGAFQWIHNQSCLYLWCHKHLKCRSFHLLKISHQCTWSVLC